ncbi:ABC transporter substrate-binding protein [Paenibacillus glycanilyticus]|uniref:ABC transporter substrate-binding protein n=1 Tax=Paenibacillus glycanilyticus TaxID=126569 RepID=A0ABQ6GB80_9BACL|nr:ABC transporter substrate-binding protein [Paenibacillus glycanilyticus]GLX66337.1 ABC transporter substrate-binding protein [Paenibacillus glycanilyticus]
MREKGIFKIASTLVLLTAVLAGCGNNGANTPASGNASNAPAETSGEEVAVSNDPIKFTFFDGNVGDSFDNPVAKKITEKTGVTLEIQQPTGNPSEKLNLMLASNDLPDMMAISRGDNLDKYIAAGALIPLNDLIDKYGPHIKEMYGDTLNKTRSADGKNYYLANWYGLEQYPVFGFMMRMDVMKELGAGDKASNGEPFTAEEFVALLKNYKEKFPSIDGKQTYAMTLNGENMGAISGTFKGMFGIMPYYETNGELKSDVRDPKYLEMIKFINSLYTQGLIDPEWATIKTQQYEQKLASGTIFASTDAFWNLGKPNTVLKEEAADPSKKDESQFYPYKVIAPGVDPAKTTYGPKSSLGWDGIGITTKNADPVRAIKFLDYLASEEGQYLMMWGVEGVHWDMKDGKHVPRQEVLDGFKKDWGAYSKETGIRKWTWTIKNGPGSDGTPYDLIGRYETDPVSALAIKNLADSSFDTAMYDNLGPSGGTPEAIKQTKVGETTGKYFPRMIMASSEAEAVKLYDTMMKELDAAGLPALEKIYTDNYNKRKELWN